MVRSNTQKMYRPREAAAVLGVSEPALRNMLHRREIPVSRMGRRLFISADDLEALLAVLRSETRRQDTR